MKSTIVLAAALIVASNAPAATRSTSSGQTYPVKPMRLISPFVPGGGTDILARAIATPASETFGEVQLTMISIVPLLPHAKAGRLRPLGISTPKRSSLLPDVPTISETVPRVEITHWYGMWGPKGMPKGIVERWNKEVARILHTDEMKARTRRKAWTPPEARRRSSPISSGATSANGAA
jgi:tripartite-type tricarboxylate transporter receptor subunit TctC